MWPGSREPLSVRAGQRLFLHAPDLTVGDEAFGAAGRHGEIAATRFIRAHRSGGGVADEYDVEVTDGIVD